MKKLLFALAALASLFSAPAYAATAAQAFIVSACGSLPSGLTYAASTYGIITMDTTGKLCDSATGGSGGTSATYGALFPSVGTPSGGTDGTNFQPLVVDTTTHYLQVDVKAGGAGGGAVYGPTAAGTAAANPPVLMGGTIDGTSTGNVDNWKIASGLGYVSAVLPSASVASGAFASGAFASGAFASGSYASGAFATGAMVDLGTIADAAATAGSTGTLSAKLRLMTTQLGTLNTTLGSPFQAGGSIGNSSFGATESGTWTVQPGNTANTTAWLFNLGQMGGTNVGAGCVAALNSFSSTVPSTVCPTFGAYVINTLNPGRAAATASSPVVAAPNLSTAGAIVPNNTTAVVVKGSAGTLFGAQLYGIGSAPAYVKIYNATSATCGSGTPIKRLMIPAASTAANGAGSNVTFGNGLSLSTGITYCVTTGITDADTTAPAASTYLVNLDYE